MKSALADQVRLGQVAVDKGYIVKEQLEQAMLELETPGVDLTLGQILLKRRWITLEQFLEIFRPTTSPDTRLLEVGISFGRYTILKCIGRGGVGAVYLARDPELDRNVAIKVLKEEIAKNDLATRRFLHEARIMAHLRHVNIVPVHEAGEINGCFFFAMEYVEGSDLTDRIYSPNASLPDLLRMLVQVATAIHYVHSNGVVHRDLKPSNILVGREGNPLVVDFGLAKQIESTTRLTRTNALMGTPQYMSPEQVSGSVKVDARTDVYALGVILYEMLTKKAPFGGESDFEMFQRIVSDDPAPPKRLNPEIAVDLQTICLKAMEKDPRRRYASAQDFAEDLERFLSGREIKARPRSIATRLVRTLWRHRALAACAAVAIVSAVVFAGVFWVRELDMRGRMASATDRLKVAADKIAEFDTSLYLEPHDLKGQDRLLREALDVAHGVMEEKVLDDATCAFEIGRALYRLGDSDGAYEMFGQAVKGHSQGRYHYERGRVALSAYQRVMDRAMGLSEAGRARWASRADVWRDRARVEFMEARRLGGLKDWEMRLAEAAMAFGERNFDAAGRVCDALAAQLEGSMGADVWKLRGDIGVETERYEDALACYQRATGIRRCFPEAYAAAARTLAFITRRAVESGADPTEFIRRGQEEAHKSLTIRPDTATVWNLCGVLQLFQAQELLRIEHSEEAAPVIAKGVEDFSTAIQLDGRMALAYLNRAAAQGLLMETQADLKDAVASLDKMIADAHEYLKIEPDEIEGLVAAAQFYLGRAKVKGAQGLEYVQDSAAFDEYIARALKLNPDYFRAWLVMSIRRMDDAVAMIVANHDPTAQVEECVAACDRALKARGQLAESWQRRGFVYQVLAQWRLAHGGDPAKAIEEALTSLDAAMRLDDRNPGPKRLHVSVGLTRLRWLIDRGTLRLGQFEQESDLLIEKCSRFLKERPMDPTVRSCRGFVRYFRAQRRASADLDPQEDALRAIEDLSVAVAANVQDPELYNTRGAAYGILMRQARTGAKDPSAYFDKALDDFNFVLKIKPEHAEAIGNRGRAYLQKALFKLDRRLGGHAELDLALADLNRAMQLENYGARPARGIALYVKAVMNKERGRPCVTELELCIQDLTGLDSSEAKHALAVAKQMLAVERKEY